MADQDEDFASMLAESEKGAPRTKRPKVGDLVRGKVISFGKDTVFVDLGGKAEGALERSQVTDSEGNTQIKVGDMIETRIVSDAGGVLSLRIRMGSRGPEAKAELQQAHELGMPVEGTVTEVIKGGVSVDVAGVRGFCPASQIDARFVEDLTTYVGQKLTFRITRYEPPRNLVLSRRVLVEEEKAKIATETRKKLEPGLVVRGKVVGFKPFGAFVDIGGMEGMLHVSELGYSRVEKPEDVLTMGQEVDVVVLKNEQVVEKGRTVDRISLSLKALATDPWRDAVAMFKEGQRLKGKVTRLMTFGAFVEIAPGIEGLVHISELGAGRRLNHPKEVVAPGQEVEATILRIDAPERKIALSLANTEGGTAEEVAESAKAQPNAKFGTFGDLLSKLKR